MNKGIRFLRAILNLFQKKTWGPFTETFEKTKFDHSFTVSWSQGGEDLALLLTLPRKGKYLDVGAHHPSRFSITRNLYQNGWNGINVDANPDLIAAFKKQRPNDKNLFNAVGNLDEYEISIFNEPAISTTNKEWESKFLSENQVIQKKVKVKGITLREIIYSNFEDEKLDLLSIDIEGSDFDALSSIDFTTLPSKFFPDWILLETQPPVKLAQKFESVKYAISAGYETWLVLPMSTLLKSPFNTF
jgi:FkbM family methyltransferase